MSKCFVTCLVLVLLLSGGATVHVGGGTQTSRFEFGLIGDLPYNHTALERETVAFDKPVVLVHGDTHYFRIDKPLFGATSKRILEHFTRVETFGAPDGHWVRGSVDPDDPQVFGFKPEIVQKNVVKHGSQ